MSAREFFESVSEASREIDRLRRQLEALEESALRVSSPSVEARVSPGRPRGLDDRIVGALDRREALERRLEDDYALIDQASWVLYGRDGITEGLQRLCPSRWWADALYLHYVDGLSYEVTGAVLGYTTGHVWQCATAALDIADAHGLAATVAGAGFAEEG